MEIQFKPRPDVSRDTIQSAPVSLDNTPSTNSCYSDVVRWPLRSSGLLGTRGSYPRWPFSGHARTPGKKCLSQPVSQCSGRAPRTCEKPGGEKMVEKWQVKRVRYCMKINRWYCSLVYTFGNRWSVLQAGDPSSSSSSSSSSSPMTLLSMKTEPWCSRQLIEEILKSIHVHWSKL